MIKKLIMLTVKMWTKATTPERKGFLKSVHVTLEHNKIKKLVAYYPKNGMPEYEVLP